MQTATATNLSDPAGVVGPQSTGNNILRDITKLMDLIFGPLPEQEVHLPENSDKPVRIFNWDEAARRIKQANARSVIAGILEDPDNTAGLIFDREIPVMERVSGTMTFTVLGSVWGKPAMMIDNESPKECWILQSETEWTPQTKWPQSALDILNAQ